MADMNQILEMVTKQGDEWQEYRATQIARIDALEKKAGRPTVGSGAQEQNTAPRESWIDTKTGAKVPVLRHGESLAALSGKSTDTPSLGRVLRGIVLGGNARDASELADERKSLGLGSDPSGGYTATGTLAAEWIDALRAQSALSKAGVTVLPMDSGQVAIARVTGDPEVSFHGESSAVPEAAPTFGKLTLNAKTAVCLVRFSLEIGQDSQNFEQQLQNVVVNAMAAAIDSAGLNGVTTNAGAAPSGILNLSGRNAVTAVGGPTTWDFLTDGVYELLADNVPEARIGSFIGHPALWKVMAQLKTGIASDNTPLTPSPEIARIPKIWTTAIPQATGVIADWGDVVMGVRQNISVKILDQAFMGSNLDLALLCYARIDFGVTRPASICTVEGITY